MKTFKQHLLETSKKEMVLDWLKRNANKIKRELNHSKRAMVILDKALDKEITDAEKKFLKAKIIDSIKLTLIVSVMSVTPGSIILFPLLAKAIPSIVPDLFRSDKTKIDFDKG